MQALTYDELLRFLQACREADERDWLMAVLAVNHGLRVGEIVGRWAVKRVNGKRERYFHQGILAGEIKDHAITIRRLKGSKRTTQPLVTHSNPLLNEREAAEKRASVRLRNQPLFKMDRSTAWRHLQRHGRTAGVRLSAASIRGMKHTLGTLGSPKVPMKILQLQMGHKSASSTLCYYDVTVESASAQIAAALGGSI